MGFNIVGISAFYHDSACCLLCDGKLIAAAEEERFTRIKHDSSFPVNAFKYCLEEGKLSIKDIDCVVFYENPSKKLSRQIWSGFDFYDPKYGDMMDPWRPEKYIREYLGFQGEIVFVDHHMSHAASAFYYSGFEDSAILIIDGVGEWATTSYGVGNNNKVTLFEQVDFPSSIGLLYSAFTSYLGFRVNSGEYKVMGLAPYGAPKYVDIIRNMIIWEDGGQYRLNMKYFDFITEKGTMYTEEFVKLFGKPARVPESEIEQFYMDVAKSLQIVLEESVFKMAQYLKQKTKCENLCMAGGVALNCVANGMLLEKGIFKKIFVQPAANDAGGVLGAAAEVYLQKTGRKQSVNPLKNVFLGASFDSLEVKNILDSASIKYEEYSFDKKQLLHRTAAILAEGNVVGWYQGRMEFGPRALGARSILADPRIEDMRDRINRMVKKREGFRPFAPSILEDNYKEYFKLKEKSPFMLFTCQVDSAVKMPAITHVDNSARVQTVNSEENPIYTQLIQEFYDITGCPALLNTSFNVRGEPIVMSPIDALLCFANTSIDYLVMEDFVINRKENSFTLIKILNKNMRTVRNTVDGVRYTFI